MANELHWNKCGQVEFDRAVACYSNSLKSAAEALAHRGKRLRVNRRTVQMALEMLAFTDLQKRVRSLEQEIAQLKKSQNSN